MQKTTFYRPAREYPPILPTEEIVINAPPLLQPAQSGAMGWLQYALPAVGGLGSLVFVFAYHSNPLLIVAAGAMALCSLGSGLLMGIFQRRSNRRQLQQQRSSYLDYLTHLHKYLLLIAQKQRQVDERLFPSYEDLTRRALEGDYLWERRPTDADFLAVRVGQGPVPLCSPLRLDLGSSTLMTQHQPELRAQAEALVSHYSYLDKLSAVIPLRRFGVISLCGEAERTRALARAILCQLAVHQSPQDIRCLLSFSAEARKEWEWAKWLPHTRCLRRLKGMGNEISSPLCMLADTREHLRALLQQQILPELERRRRLSEGEDGKKKEILPVEACLPHLFIILDDFLPRSEISQLPELETLFNDCALFGVTILCLVKDLSQEPAQIAARLRISPIGGLIFEEKKYGGEQLEGLRPDGVSSQFSERIARGLAPLTLVEAGSTQDLSQDIRLLDLLAVPSLDTFNPQESAWQARPRADFLRVPLGMQADGRLLTLDLKEAADEGMGPHGLIVGATGSGKSELLRTLVVALAATHDPHLLNFVLIDFKGGASFADFAALPHVAGIVTNLQSDLSLVDRVYFSLLGEQQRRQRLLHEAGNLDNIKQYQLMWQMNPGMEPMPHLLLIADEFAELIASRSDFLDLFVTMGRVGRSLGLHLLFATQRLEEGRIRGLESHLRYRICLRTFSAAESRTVLGTTDAYFLPSVPGMGYFKVDADAPELFKTALVSVPYVPAEVQRSLSSMVRLFTPTGQLQRLPAPVDAAPSSPQTLASAEVEAGELRTEMDVMIERLAQTKPQDADRQVHQVWLPPLSRAIPLYDILTLCQAPDLAEHCWGEAPPFGELRVPVGLLDIPLSQQQQPLWLDFSGSGGHLALVGAPQAGKSTFLRTLITSFMMTHSPRDVQFYCIDMGGGLLRIFEQAPHVGAVSSKAERDKVRRIVNQMRKVIEDREFLFRERGIESMATYRALRQQGGLADEPFGDVFLIIDNFAQFFQDFDQLEPALVEIVTGGLAYGVHLILAANRWMEIRPKVRDNIGARLEFRLNDPSDSELGKATASAIPADVPGRGATRDRLYFQTALPVIEPGSDLRRSTIQESLLTFVRHASLAWRGEPAPPINMLPPLVHLEELPVAEKRSGIPIGLEEFRLSPFYVDLIAREPHFIILGDTECGKTSLLRTWMRGLEQGYLPQEVSFAIIDYRKQLLDFAESKHLISYAYNPLTLASCIGNLRSDLEKRVEKSSGAPLSELRHTRNWGGRHLFLFVDDYESISGTGGSQLLPLADYLLNGRDIGFHLVVTHRVGGMARASFEPIFQRLREMGTSGLIMSGDPSEGKLLYGLAASPLPAGRGYFVQSKHPPVLIQTAWGESVMQSETPSGISSLSH